MRRTLFVAPLLLVALVGLGCRKGGSPTSTSGTSTESQVYLPPPAAPEDESTKNIRELRSALENFENAKTFRAKMTLTTSESTVSGQIDVMKPDRFHGTMNSSGQQDASELIGIGDMLYVKTGKDQWAYVKDAAKAKAYTQAFRSSVNSQASLLPQVLPDGLTVSKVHDASLGCDRYSTTITSTGTSTASASVQVCVVNGLPKRIVVAPENGSATIDYFDYNKLFVIERPVGLYK